MPNLPNVAVPKNLNPLVFLKEVKAELEKVTWPTREELIRLTLLVMVISLIVAVFIGIIDYILTLATGIILKG